MKIVLLICGILTAISGVAVLTSSPFAGVLCILIGVLFIVLSRRKLKYKYKFHVAGLSYYWENYRENLNPESEFKVDLVPEPENPHDKNAIKVLLNGLQVGHVPKDKTAEVRKVLPYAYEIDAYVDHDEDYWEAVEIIIWYRK